MIPEYIDPGDTDALVDYILSDRPRDGKTLREVKSVKKRIEHNWISIAADLDAGMSVAEVAKKHGVTDKAIYSWKARQKKEARSVTALAKPKRTEPAPVDVTFHTDPLGDIEYSLYIAEQLSGLSDELRGRVRAMITRVISSAKSAT